MSKPGSGWIGEEPGAVCGHTWASPIVVRGTLPNGFGYDRFVMLSPVIDEIPRTDFGTGIPDVVAELLGVGYGGPVEDAVRDELERKIADLQAAAEAAGPHGEGWLTSEQVYTVNRALRQAQQQLDAARDVQRAWRDRKTGSWPLLYADRLDNFLAAADPQQCAGIGWYGRWVEGRGRTGKVRCPDQLEVTTRPKARQFVYELFVDAATWIRCAEFGLQRMRLYAQSRRDYIPAEGGGLRIPTPPQRQIPGPGELGVPFQPPEPEGPSSAEPIPERRNVPVAPGASAAPFVPTWPPDYPMPKDGAAPALPPPPIPPEALPTPSAEPVQTPSTSKAALGIVGLIAVGIVAKSAGIFR